jgi:lipopolysaccharide transport system permease protein
MNWHELWRFRDLFVVLAWRDISVRYKQAVLGVAWVILQPLVTMIVFTFVFNSMGGIKSGDGTPYPVFLYVGLLFWQYCSGTLTAASTSMVGNAAMIQKVYFPRLILPATAAATGLVDLAISSLLLVGMLLYYHIVPTLASLLILPGLLTCTVTFSLGIGFLLASLNIKYRDVRFALPFFIQTMMYVTPVIYPVKMLDAHTTAKALMLWINPIAGVITNARAALLGQGPIDFGVFWISLTMSTVYFVGGLIYFKNTERHFADIM